MAVSQQRLVRKPSAFFCCLALEVLGGGCWGTGELPEDRARGSL